MTEYEKHLKQMESLRKERYLKEFESLENGEIFRKHKIDITTDYEFVEDNGEIETVIYKNSNRVLINICSLYFKKINNNECMELETGERFYRTYDNTFYNESTGLKFDFSFSFEKAVGMELDCVYTHNTINYFNHYKELQDKDNEMRNKGLSLLLKNGIRFIKKRNKK